MVSVITPSLIHGITLQARQVPGRISKPANTYDISESYSGANAECNNVTSLNNTLVKKYGNWDQQHANGFKFKLNNAPKFSEIEYLVFDLYIDSAASTLPTKSEIADKFTNLSPSSLSLTQAELDQFDDGLYQIDIQLNVDLPNPTFSDPNYETEGDVHGTINLQVAREDADQWLRVEVPVKEMIFREEAPNWAIDTISYDDAKDLAPSDLSFMAETTSRKVYRHYKNDDPSFNEFAIPELFKEQAIRLRYVGIGADPVDEFFAAITDPVADFSISRTGTVVNLDAAATKLGSAEEHSYSWSVSNGDVAEGEQATFDLAVAGSYDITLTVKDLVNLKEHSVTQTVQIEDAGTGDCSQGGLNFCADFEAGLPTTELNKNAGTYEVDNSIGYNSSSSVKVSTKFYNNGGFFEVTPPAADFWTRVFIRSSGDTSGKAPGGDEQGFARPHGVILKAVDGNAQLRVGDHRCQLEINRDGGTGHLGDDWLTSGNYGDDATVCEKDLVLVCSQTLGTVWKCILMALKVNYRCFGIIKMYSSYM